MTARQILRVVIFFLPLVGLLLGCAPPNDEGRPQVDSVNVRLKWLHQAQFAGFYTAEGKGFYEQQRIKVNLNPGGVEFPAVQMVATGREQFGVTGADQILLAREKGMPVVALAVIFRKSPMVLFALKETGIKTPKDFPGKTIGVKLGGNEELTYRALLRRTSIDPRTINEVPVKYDMSPLFSGAVDVWPGYAINEVIVAKEQGHDVNVIWPSEYGVSLYADTLFTTESMIRDHPDLVRRFVLASLEGWKYAYDHPAEAVDFTLQYGENLARPHELAMMEASLPLLRPDAKPLGAMEQGVWLSMQQLLLEGGFMKQSIVVEKAYTAQFLEN